MDKTHSLGNNPQLDILKAKLSQLQTEISAPEDLQGSDLHYNNIVEILENEIKTFKVEIEFESALSKKLLEEDERISKYIQEEEHILKCIDQYQEKISKLNESRRQSEAINESILDERKEMFFKLEVLHRKLIMLIRRFTKRYFPPSEISPSNDLFNNSVDDANMESKPKKSLLDILSALIVELSREEDAEPNARILHVDDTIWQGYINFLVCANIIERCPEDPNYVKLK